MRCGYCKKELKLKSKRGHRRRYCNTKCSGKARWQRIKSNPHWRLKSIAVARVSLTKRTSERWARIFAIHGNKCHKCLHSFPRCCYDLHHIKPGLKKSKRENSAVVIREGTNAQFDALLKITLLTCANCHRIIHDNGKPYGKE